MYIKNIEDIINTELWHSNIINVRTLNKFQFTFNRSVIEFKVYWNFICGFIIECYQQHHYFIVGIYLFFFRYTYFKCFINKYAQLCIIKSIHLGKLVHFYLLFSLSSQQYIYICIYIYVTICKYISIFIKEIYILLKSLI